MSLQRMSQIRSFLLVFFAFIFLFGVFQLLFTNGYLSPDFKFGEVTDKLLDRRSRKGNSECDLSNEFNLARAIASPYLLKTRSVKNLTILYATQSGIVKPLKDLTKLLKPENLPKPKPNQRCIVVGSSGALLNFPDLGAVIDSYDYVIRINFAPTNGFEKYVGSKTSINLGYLTACQKAVQSGRQLELNGSYILYGGRYHWEFESLKQYLMKDPQTDTNVGPMVKMLLSNKISFYLDYTRHWTQKVLFENTKVQPTTGFQALVIMSQWCPTPPDFAGFSLKSNSSVPYHYFNHAVLKLSRHYPRDEIAAINRMQRCGIIGRDLTQGVGT